MVTSSNSRRSVGLMSLGLLLLTSINQVEAGQDPGYKIYDDMAKCLDGSPPMYYMRNGWGEGANKWMLYYEGGGWCANSVECYERSQTDLGSSKEYAPFNGLDWDMLQNDAQANGVLYNWNIVFVKYCDGGLYSANQVETDYYNGTELFYRGRFIQEAIIKDLIQTKNMNQAQEVIIGGCSAGGMSAFVNIDYLSTLLPPTVQRVMGVPDSGVLFNYQGPGKCNYEQRMMDFYKFQKVQSNIPQQCIDKLKGDAWKCIFFAEHVIPYVKTPLFIMQSKFDNWQRKYLYCGGEANIEGINTWGKAFEDMFWKVAGQDKDGAFMDSCGRHCGGWNKVQSNTGITQRAAFEAWYKALLPTTRIPAATTTAAAAPMKHKEEEEEALVVQHVEEKEREEHEKEKKGEKEGDGKNAITTPSTIALPAISVVDGDKRSPHHHHHSSSPLVVAPPPPASSYSSTTPILTPAASSTATTSSTSTSTTTIPTTNNTTTTPPSPTTNSTTSRDEQQQQQQQATQAQVQAEQEQHAEQAAIVPPLHTFQGIFKYRNTGRYPCVACCNNGFQVVKEDNKQEQTHNMRGSATSTSQSP